MNKEPETKINNSIYETRTYLLFLTIINFIWLYCIEMPVNIVSIMSGCIVFFTFYWLYRNHGREYVLSIVYSNLFFSLFLCIFPFSFLALIAAVAKDFFFRDFIKWGWLASISMFVFSSLNGLIFSFFSCQNKVVQFKIKFLTRLKINLYMFLILFVFYYALSFIYKEIL